MKVRQVQNVICQEDLQENLRISIYSNLHMCLQSADPKLDGLSIRPCGYQSALPNIAFSTLKFLVKIALLQDQEPLRTVNVDMSEEDDTSTTKRLEPSIICAYYQILLFLPPYGLDEKKNKKSAIWSC